MNAAAPHAVDLIRVYEQLREVEARHEQQLAELVAQMAALRETVDRLGRRPWRIG